MTFENETDAAQTNLGTWAEQYQDAAKFCRVVNKTKQNQSTNTNTINTRHQTNKNKTKETNFHALLIIVFIVELGMTSIRKRVGEEDITNPNPAAPT